jgi:hypothetical protein
MSRFVVKGTVRAMGEKQRNIAVENIRELREFWTAENIVTQLDWAGTSPPLVTVSARELVNQCERGDEVEYVIETCDRASGRGIRGLDLRVITRAAAIG